MPLGFLAPHKGKNVGKPTLAIRKRMLDGVKVPHGAQDAYDKEQLPQNKNLALEGLRALAILSVVLYHFKLSWIPSGHMGVVIFLVLSGYLICQSVIKRLETQGTTAYFAFIKTRLIRIWPAMACVVLATLFLTVVFNHVLLTKMRPDTIPSLFMVSNLASIIRGDSYFDAIGGPSPLLHLWYLGLDFQFALIFPIVMMLVKPWLDGRRLPAIFILVGLSVISCGAMAIMAAPDVDPSRVYYGPDTRAFSLLLGATLALVLPLSGKLTISNVWIERICAKPIADIVGLIGFIIILMHMLLVPDTSIYLYWGGILIVSIATLLLMIPLILPATIVHRCMSLPPLVWLGSRSFGIYLWHFPVIQLIGVQGSLNPLQMLIVFFLSCLLAEVSHRVLEDADMLQQLFATMLYGSKNVLSALFAGIGNFITARTAGNSSLRPQTRSSRTPNTFASSHKPEPKLYTPVELIAAIGNLAFVVVVITSTIGYATIPDETLVPKDAIVNQGTDVAHATKLEGPSDDSSDSSSQTNTQTSTESSDTTQKTTDSSSSTQSNSDAQNSELPTGQIVLRESKEDIQQGLYSPMLIGDSVPGDTSNYFSAYFPTGHLDSYVGRRPDQMAKVLDEYLQQGVVGKIVVLEAWSNMTATDDAIKAMIDACGDRQIFFVNTHIPQDVGVDINAQLQRIAEGYENVHLIDWHSLAEQHPEYLYADGTHLKPAGQEPYISLIANAIAQTFKDLGGRVEKQDPTDTIKQTPEHVKQELIESLTQLTQKLESSQTSDTSK